MEKRFHTPLSLGNKRHMTREGYLVCLDVPMSRIATLDSPMLYGPNETPVPPGADGITRIVRDEEELFGTDSILSLVGKPVTNDHPPMNVTPDTWNKLSVGSVISARRGTGDTAGYVVGDIMIMDKRAIQDVLQGKREVSCGYDAEYDEIGPGVGRQREITYNHLALVDKGRCGSACSIGDYQPKELLMAGKASFVDRAKAYFLTRDEEGFNKLMAEEGEAIKTGAGDVHIHVGGKSGGNDEDPAGADPAGGDPAGGASSMEERMAALEAAVKQIAAALEKKDTAGDPEQAEALRSRRRCRRTPT